MDTIKPTHPAVGALVPADNEPEADRRQCHLDEDLARWLKVSLWDKCEKMHENKWRAAKKNMIRARQYFDGNQCGTVTDSYEWREFSRQPGEIYYTDNVYYAHIMTMMMELSRGETRLNFAPASEESRTGDLIARIAESRYTKVHRPRLFSPLKMQQEILSLLLNSLALRYTYVKWKTNARTEKIPVFGDLSAAPEQSARTCAVCGTPRGDKMPTGGDDYATDRAAFAESATPSACPNCGSTEVETIEAPNIQGRVIQGYEQGREACSEWVTPDPLGVVFDINAASLDESAYLIWNQVVLTDVLKSQYPDAKLSEGITSETLREQYAQNGSTANSTLTGESADKDLSEFGQGWFDPPLYAHKVLNKPVRLRSGVTLPAGTRLGDAFPDGLYIARNGEKILDLWNEPKKAKWTCAPFVTRFGTLAGAGTSVAFSQQECINDLRNLQMQSVMNDAFRKEFVNRQYLEPENIPDNPRERAVIENMPESGRIVGTAIDVLPPSSLSTDAYALPETIQGSIQNQLGTFSATASGMPDLKAAQNTYGGMQLLRDVTVGRFYPMLSARADALDKEQAYQLLENDRQNLSPAQWEKYKGDYGAEAVQAFLACDLREDLVISVVPESFMPETPSQRLSKTVGFLELMVNLAPVLNPDMGAYLASQFNVPQHVTGFDAAYSIAVRHIQIFTEISEIIVSEFGDVPTYDLNNPQTLQLAMLVLQQANIPIVPDMDDTTVLANAYQDWWRQDDGRTASNLLKAVLTLRLEEIKQGAALTAQADAQLALEAQRPVMDQQAAQMQEQAATEDERAMREREQETLREQDSRAYERENRAMDLSESERQRQFEMEQSDADRAHQLEMAKLNAQNKAQM